MMAPSASDSDRFLRSGTGTPVAEAATVTLTVPFAGINDPTARSWLSTVPTGWSDVSAVWLRLIPRPSAVRRAVAIGWPTNCGTLTCGGGLGPGPPPEDGMQTANAMAARRPIAA